MLLQINGNWIAILRFCFEVLTPELFKPDKKKLKVNKGLSRWLQEIRIPLRRREHNKVGKVVKRKQQHATSRKTKEMFYRTTFVLQTFLIASKLHATWYNNIQHDTTTYNKVVKRCKLFLHNKCCTLLYEKLGSFDRGLTLDVFRNGVISLLCFKEQKHFKTNEFILPNDHLIATINYNRWFDFMI